MRGLSLPGTIVTHYSFLAVLPTAPAWLNKVGPFTLNIEMFFVLSGALITSLLVSEHQRTGDASMKKFYLRRSRRLAPALIAVVPILLICQFAIHRHGQELAPLGHSPWITAGAVLIFLGNWRLFAVGGDGLGWLGPAWTLGIEEQFYLTWPVLLRAAMRRFASRRAILLGLGLATVISVGIATVVENAVGWNSSWYITPSQLPTVLLGCALGYELTTNSGGRLIRLLESRLLALVGLAGMVVISIEFNGDGIALARGGYVAYGVAACLLIGHCFAVAGRETAVSKVLGWRPFAIVGQVSYEAYLVHLVVILAVLYSAPTMPVPWMIALDSVIIAVVSGLFYYLIERPIRRRGWRGALGLSPRPVSVGPAAAAAPELGVVAPVVETVPRTE
jgi:peptidoglycan/LPS O-acetylase OafA/YrhL